MIEVRELVKKFSVHTKEPGLKGSIKAVFHRAYRHKLAVNGVSFSIDEGSIVGLVGSNGAGKTTLVKMLAGIIHPSSGSASVLGFTPWERRNEFRRQIALVMGQKPQLWWDLPAADCFLLLREIYQVEHAEFKRRLEYLCEALAVTDYLKVQVRRLSLGERMKMEIIASLLHNPRVVFLDEPTIGLDITAQRAIRKFLLEYRQRHRPAMIVTSHYMDDIEELCERILVIRGGSFVFDGKLREIIDRWAPYKVVAGHLDREVSPQLLAQSAGVPEADLELNKVGEFRLRVPRGHTARALSGVLSAFPVHDLSIEEENIATIVEGIMTARRGDVSLPS